MSKRTIYTCDRCSEEFDAGVTNVEVTFGGHGAARDKVDGIDLCRSCYGGLVRAIRDACKYEPVE